MGPTWVIVLPMARKAGIARSTWLAFPPTMMLRVPLAAPSLPPLMGASSISTPCSPSRFESCRVALGLIVLMSTTSDPGLTPELTPLSPRITSSTSGVSLTQVMTMSDFKATSARSSPATAPASTRGPIRDAVRFHTRTGSPASRRFATIPRPMIPRPMNPMLRETSDI